MSGATPESDLRYEVYLKPSAANDYIELDASVRLEVTKALVKLMRDPRGYGEPLGNKAGLNLFGCFSIRAGKRFRIVFRLERQKDGSEFVLVLTIGKRDRFLAYRTARERIEALTKLAEERIEQLVNLVELMQNSPGQGA